MANVAISNITSNWTNGATVYTAFRMAVTDTASAAGSLLQDLLVGGVSKFSVSKAGDVTAAGAATFSGALSAGNTSLTGTLGVTGLFTLGSARLSGAAANILALRNGTSAQGLVVSNTYTDASNYEEGFLKFSSNVFLLGCQQSGTGTLRKVALQMAVGGAAPGTSDIPSGYGMLWKDTGGGTVKLYVNDSGTIKSVALT